MEAAVAKSLQAALDECRTGLYVVNVGLVDVHAPPEVHWAFRDVASAAEDKAKVINEADEYRERVVPEAQAKHETQALAAQASAVEAVRQAEGRGAAFVARLSAYRENPAVTRTRLYLESMDTVLPALSKYVALSEAVDRAIDLWWVRQSGGPAAGSGPNGDWLRGQAGELGGPRGGRDGGSP